MYEYKASYIKWSIRTLGLLHWLFPKKLEVVIKENVQFTKESPFFLTIYIWFRIDGRLFRCALPSNIHFENVDEVPEAFLKAFERAVKKIEKEEVNGKRTY